MAEGNREKVPYVRIARKFFVENKFWLERRRFSYAEAWLDLIQLAWFKGGEWLSGGAVYDVRRGQFPTTLTYLAERWRWSRARVRRFLEQQRLERAVSYRSDGRCTVITLLNYDYYNPERTSQGRPASGGASPHGLPTATINKGKEGTEGREGKEGKEVKEACEKVFDAWNSHPRIFPKHRRLTAAVRRAVAARLRDFAAEQLVAAVNNYGDSDEPFWREWREDKRGWSLEQFLSRGEGAKVDKFLPGPLRGRGDAAYTGAVNPDGRKFLK